MIRVAAQLVLAVLFFCSTLAGFAQPSIAFLDAVLDPEVNPSVQGPVTERIIQELVSSGEYTVLDRSYVAQVLSERQFQLSGMVDNAEIKEAGIYLGATYVGVARVSRIGTTFFISGRIINVETGVITAQTSSDRQGTIDVVLALASEVGRQLAGGKVESLADVPKPVAEPSKEPLGQAPAEPKAPAPDKQKPSGGGSRRAGGTRFAVGGGAGVATSVGEEWEYWGGTWAMFSWTVEGRIDIPLSEQLVLGSGVYLVTKGIGYWQYAYDSYYDAWFDGEYEETMTYLQIPITGKAFLPGTGLFLGAGIGLNLSIAQSAVYEEYYYYPWYETFSGDSPDWYYDGFAGFSASFLGLVGMEITLTGNSVLGVETGIDYHLMDDFDYLSNFWWNSSRRFFNWKLSSYISF